MEILYNEVYIGSVINNKTADNIDTGHQVVQRDKEAVSYTHLDVYKRQSLPSRLDCQWMLCGKLKLV